MFPLNASVYTIALPSATPRPIIPIDIIPFACPLPQINQLANIQASRSLSCRTTISRYFVRAHTQSRRDLVQPKRPLATGTLSSRGLNHVFMKQRQLFCQHVHAFKHTKHHLWHSNAAACGGGSEKYSKD